MNFEFLALEQDGAVARLVLRRPPLNVIHGAMAREIVAALEACRGQARIVQFEAAPECRAFSAGVEVADHLPARAPAMLAGFHAIFRLLEPAEFLTLALVRGAALGGGAELACACDAVLAAEDAVFGFPEITVGSFPPVGVVLLPKLVGLRRAQEWILTGRNISSAEALASGLISRVVPALKLEEEATIVRAAWLKLSAPVLAVARRALAGDFSRELDAAEALYRDHLLRLADAREGVEAFLARRAPAWKHL